MGRENRTCRRPDGHPAVYVGLMGVSLAVWAETWSEQGSPIFWIAVAALTAALVASVTFTVRRFREHWLPQRTERAQRSGWSGPRIAYASILAYLIVVAVLAALAVPLLIRLLGD